MCDDECSFCGAGCTLYEEGDEDFVCCEIGGEAGIATEAECLAAQGMIVSINECRIPEGTICRGDGSCEAGYEGEADPGAGDVYIDATDACGASKTLCSGSGDCARVTFCQSEMDEYLGWKDYSIYTDQCSDLQFSVTCPTSFDYCIGGNSSLAVLDLVGPSSIGFSPNLNFLTVEYRVQENPDPGSRLEVESGPGQELVPLNVTPAHDGAKFTATFIDDCSQVVCADIVMNVVAWEPETTPDDEYGPAGDINCDCNTGDPVNLYNGEFWEEQVDLAVPGRGFPFEWKRKYRSRKGSNTVQGNGWDFNYNITLESDPQGVRLSDGKGRKATFFTRPNNEFQNPKYFRNIKQLVNAEYEMEIADGTRYFFHPFSTGTIAGKISRLEDRNGNVMDFAYDVQGKLIGITDTLGRAFTLTYNQDGYLASVSDWSGSRMVSYEYYQNGDSGGSAGDLKSVTRSPITGTFHGNDFPSGITTLYTYTTGFADEALNHNLTSITDGRGVKYLENFYSSVLDPAAVDYDRLAGQNYGQTGGQVDRLDFHYVEGLDPAANRNAEKYTIVNDQNGNVSEHYFDKFNQLVARKEFTGRANPNTPTTETQNRPGNWHPKLREPNDPICLTNPQDPACTDPGDPDSFDSYFVYNPVNNLLVESIDPNGMSTRFFYQGDFRSSTSTNAGNVVMKIHSVAGSDSPVPPHPNLLPGDNPVLIERWEYEEDFNQVSKRIDFNGNETSYKYDAQGNLIRIQHADPFKLEYFEYNSYGQVTAHTYPIDESGHYRRDETKYFGPSQGAKQGYVRKTITDANPGGFRLVTKFDVNEWGENIQITDPAGNVASLEYNGHGRVIRELTPLVGTPAGDVRYETRYFYNENGDVVRRDIANIDGDGNLVAGNPWISFLSDFESRNFVTRTCTEKGSYNGLARTPAELSSGDFAEFICTETQYDGNRNTILVKTGEAVNGNQPDNVMQTIYDERDLAFSTTAAPGSAEASTTRIDYDGNQNLVRVQQGMELPEADRSVTIHVYDYQDRKDRTIDAMGNVTTYHYDPNGNLGSGVKSGGIGIQMVGELVDLEGTTNPQIMFQSTTDFDALNRAVSSRVAFREYPTWTAPVSHPDGESTSTTEYNLNSQVLRTIDDNGNQAVVSYDTMGRVLSTTDPKGNSVLFAYDANSNLISKVETDVSDSGGASEVFVTTYEYDALNRLIRTVDPIGNEVTQSYDSRNNITRTADPRGNETLYSYDGVNRLLATTRILHDGGYGAGPVIGQITTSQEWDDNSRLIAQIDENGNETRYAYSARGFPVATQYADGTLEQHGSGMVWPLGAARPDPGYSPGYDVLGRKVLSQDPNGTILTFHYDKLGRLIDKVISPGPGVSQETTFESFQYDSLSRMVRAEDDDSVVTWAYNSLGQVVQETLQIGSGSIHVMDSAYDALGNRINYVYPGGRSVTQAFDSLNRIADISEGASAIASFQYLGMREEFCHYGNGTSKETFYDAARRVTRTLQKFGTTIFDDRAYTWDESFNKTSRQNLLTGNLNHVYQYDSLDRMVLSQQFQGAVLVDQTEYILDGVGNRTSTIGGTHPGMYFMNNALPGSIDYPTNRYTSTPLLLGDNQYDLNGNLIAMDDPASDSGPAPDMQLIYNYRNQLVGINDSRVLQSHQYRYDALGRRIEKLIDSTGAGTITQYYYDGDRVVEERDAGDQVVVTYIYGPFVDEPITMARGGQHYVYHTDDMFNVMALTDQSGSLVESYEYEDYGAVLDGSTLQPLTESSLGNPYLFQGRRYDPESQLYFFRSRYLDPLAGRFTTRDSLGVWGDPGNYGNPYTFVSNNPWTKIDPYGEQEYYATGELRLFGDATGGKGFKNRKFGPGLVAGFVAELPGALWQEGKSAILDTLGFAAQSAFALVLDIPAYELDHVRGTSEAMHQAPKAIYEHFSALLNAMRNADPLLLKEISPEAYFAYVCESQLTDSQIGRKLSVAVVREALMVGSVAAGGVGAIKALRSLTKKVRLAACFVAGTLVLTADGYVPIEELEVGDRVLSTELDPEEDRFLIEEEGAEVEELYRNLRKISLRVTSQDGSTLILIIVRTHSWLAERELQEGSEMEIMDEEGGLRKARILRIQEYL